MPLTTFSGIVMNKLYEAISEMGLDADAVVTEAEYGSVLDNDINAQLRITHNNGPRLWEIIERETGDKHPGLHVGASFDVPQGLGLAYLYLSSPTFGDALYTGLSYSRLLSDALSFSIDGFDPENQSPDNQTPENPAGICVLEFKFDLPDIQYRRHLAELTAAALDSFFRNVTANAFKPVSVGFEHSQPDDISEHKRIFGCEVKFGQDRNTISFDSKLLQRPCLLPEPAMAEAHLQVIDDQLLHLQNHDLIHIVTDAIGRILSRGDVSLERVAEDLGLKPARLRYLLSELGTSFSELLSEYRAEMAKQLLSDTDDSIDQIIFLTGFSEPSPFYRAFKRWTGMTPVSFRKQQRSSKQQ